MTHAAPNIRPSRCCACGSYECQIPMPIRGRIRGIDFCISDIVAALNAANILTVASCCGHGTQEAIISLDDGRDIIISKEHIVRPWERITGTQPVDPAMKP